MDAYSSIAFALHGGTPPLPHSLAWVKSSRQEFARRGTQFLTSLCSNWPLFPCENGEKYVRAGSMVQIRSMVKLCELRFLPCFEDTSTYNSFHARGWPGTCCLVARTAGFVPCVAARRPLDVGGAVEGFTFFPGGSQREADFLTKSTRVEQLAPVVLALLSAK